MPRTKKKETTVKRSQRNQFKDDSDDEEGGYLTIGGVRVQVTSQGNVSQITRGGGRQSRSASQQQRAQQGPFPRPASDIDSEGDEEMDSDDMLDYLQNVGAPKGTGSSSREGEDEEALLPQPHQYEMLRLFGGVGLGDEGAPEDIIGRFDSEDEEESSDDESSTSDGEGFVYDGQGFCEGHTNVQWDVQPWGHQLEAMQEDRPMQEWQDGAFGGASGVLNVEQWEALHPSHRFPIAARPPPPPAPPSYPPAQSGKKDKKKGKGNAFPGQKKKEKRERLEVRRASRRLGGGFDLFKVNQTLQTFVYSGQDVVVFPPMRKPLCKDVQKMASLYGCRSGAQGPTNGKRCVVVQMTQWTGIPQGQALEELNRMLSLYETARQGLMTATPAGNDRVVWHSNNLRNTQHQQEQQQRGQIGSGANAVSCSPKGKNGKKNKKKSGRRGDVWMENEILPSSVGGKKQGKLSRPVAFVSKGVINPEEDASGMKIEVVKRSSAADYETSRNSGGNDDDEEEPTTSAAAAGLNDEGVTMLPLLVFEDRLGGGNDAVPLYHTMAAEGGTGSGSGVGLDFQSGGAKNLSSMSRGASAAEGITNSGRLLGLGMALGIGAEVFGAPGLGGDVGGAAMSPLQRKLSKTEQKKLNRRRTHGAGALPEAQVAKEAAPVRRAATGPAPVSGDYADFEQHTTGIGSKLLKKWGFAGQGAGLGREGNGIKEPVQVKMRAKGLGLGAER